MPSDFGGHSMVQPLRRVLLCPPDACGYHRSEATVRFAELGHAGMPNAAAAGRQHQFMAEKLAGLGCDIVELPGSPELSLDAVYSHDASLMTHAGAILLRMGKPNRSAEPAAHGACFQDHNIAVLGSLREPATAEAGDLLWLSDNRLWAGTGFRTNDAGVEQLRSLLQPQGVTVETLALPQLVADGHCLHLMSMVSLLNEQTALVDLEWMPESGLHVLAASGFECLPIEPSERETLACNVLALGHDRLLTFAENPITNQRLQQHGFEVYAMPGSDIGINGEGGPTCLTRPLLRRAE